jgi:hypothetical protein
MPKTPRRLCEKKRKRLKWIMCVNWSKPTPVSYVVDATSLEHCRFSSKSWPDVRKTGRVARLVAFAKNKYLLLGGEVTFPVYFKLMYCF